MIDQNQEQEFLAAIEKADHAFNSFDINWFNYLTDDVTVFSINQTVPIVGREAYKEAFGKSFDKFKRTAKILNRQIQIIDCIGLVTQTIQVGLDDTLSTVRQTVVWQRSGTDKVWLIKHLHSALIGSPIATTPPSDLESAVALNEKIATVSAVVGLAQ